MDGEESPSKILVPLDGSDLGLLAGETVLTVAKKTEATVTVLHVIHEFEEYYRLLYAATGLGHDIPSNIIREILELTEQEANKIVNDAQALFNKEKIAVDTKILKSIDAADSIIELSKKGFDLIVIGAHGKNEKNPYALGSVTKKVIRHANCPTLFVKKTCALSNLLVCIDGSEHSIKALDYSVKLAGKIGSKITLLNVQEHRLHSLSSHACTVCQGLGESILSKALGVTQGKGLKVDSKVKFGVTSDVIVDVAEKGNYDLIVLGSRGLGTVKRFLLGSVSDDVSHKAQCSVLIYRARA